MLLVHPFDGRATYGAGAVCDGLFSDASFLLTIRMLTRPTVGDQAAFTWEH